MSLAIVTNDTQEQEPTAAQRGPRTISFANNNKEIVSKNQSLFRVNVGFMNVGVIFSIFGKKFKFKTEIDLY